jgi:glycerol-3-phosphate O-acyltransferase
VRPPIIAAGINLFGGPLGLIHKHVTGAMPIRRNTKDPAYLITLKAYVAELLHKHDLFFYPEGGRSYSGELKVVKTGLLSACLDAGVRGMSIVPVAVSYDLVLEDHVLARQGVKRRQRPFSREIAEMVRYAVGFRTRAFVTFGRAIALDSFDTDSRKSVADLARILRSEIGRLYKVLPTAVLAAAMRPSITRKDLEQRITAQLETLRAVGANLGVASADEVIALATEPLETRGIIVLEQGRYRVRERNVLRYYARSIAHLLHPAGSTH